MAYNDSTITEGNDMTEAPAVYEFGGIIYSNIGEFLDALAHEYKVGDRELVIATLEDYRLSLADIGA
jgi:hypothetical protein